MYQNLNIVINLFSTSLKKELDKLHEFENIINLEQNHVRKSLKFKQFFN